ITKIIFANFWPKELEDELVEEPHKSVSDSLVKLSSDSLNTLHIS
ncbi:4568_t:CDS:1, partial [Funneliformis geosporum]